MTEKRLNVLVVGSGGREHALAWKIAQSSRLGHLVCAPGNPGMAALGENISIPALGVDALSALAHRKQIDLAVIGPEAALEAGLSDALRAAGVAVFGPSRAAARIETSKAFAKDFMARHNIPTARYAVFQDLQAAHAHLDRVDYPVVLKASGLASGKGVLLPASLAEAHAALDSLMIHLAYGEAGREVVIEERLQGEEVSLLAFCDGQTLRPMPAAQDHKRLLDGDQGPNTGGMGAYAPAPAATPEIIERAVREVLQPALDGLRAEGLPFCGALYAGLMLTAEGPKVLEFNARFGDPETQVILPLLESDLLEVLEACALGKLNETEVRWKSGAAACVVLAAPGYPEHPQVGQVILGLEKPIQNGAVFHAGTALAFKHTTSIGGRVLGVTCWAENLPSAVQSAYQAIEGIHFDGMQYRHDIAARALKPASVSAYAAAGVNIDAGNRAVALMSQAVRSTYSPAVLAGIGAFGGLFDAAALGDLRQPVLVASTDGVGTKVKLAAQLRRYGSIGADLVNHCINDILVQGARPLFFLDYFASASIDPEIVATVVGGLAAACRETGVALLGGETAEMPGVYQPTEFDLAGTIVGALDRERMLPHPDLHPGDVLIGLRSSGPHTNGYSLIRRVFSGADLTAYVPELNGSLGDALLAPHRCYLNLLIGLIEQPDSPIRALAHLTGGGFIENIPRVLPQGLGAQIQRGTWPVPPLFQLIQRQGRIESSEMHRVFNMGIGMVAVVSPDRAAEVQSALPEETWIVGQLVAGERRVELL
ncbi:phosphoribosylamine--glycine ligase [Longilinea arvoryzae]|uniref:Multifunctional fusion protein n=1 Tax=Longilinea arvoryzae TaxID=360412 RepID=A0A0S7BET8_9CHLR|nr:phosphoribosylamine--glycine ligase [Longilinea arvoryzae]GAP12950.1 phosphoribosylamine--glycine ligase [Longilinea arvoryzae]